MSCFIHFDIQVFLLVYDFLTLRIQMWYPVPLSCHFLFRTTYTTWKQTTTTTTTTSFHWFQRCRHQNWHIPPRFETAHIRRSGPACRLASNGFGLEEVDLWNGNIGRFQCLKKRRTNPWEMMDWVSKWGQNLIYLKLDYFLKFTCIK